MTKAPRLARAGTWLLALVSGCALAVLAMLTSYAPHLLVSFALLAAWKRGPIRIALVTAVAVIVLAVTMHLRMTGAFWPINLVHELQDPAAVAACENDALLLANGVRVSIEDVPSVPCGAEFLQQALRQGIEVTHTGRPVGLVKIHHWCGNDPVGLHLARVDIGELLSFFDANEGPEDRLWGEPRFDEHGWNVTQYYWFRNWSLSEREPVDAVRVDKSEAMLYLMASGSVVAEFPVAFGANPEGHKRQEGDERTPEGQYVLDYKKADSAFYRAIHISYPNDEDGRRAAELGVSPGGQIMIHGQRNGFGWLSAVTQLFNWTDGCIALTNGDMDSVWSMVEVGTPILIEP